MHHARVYNLASGVLSRSHLASEVSRPNQFVATETKNTALKPSCLAGGQLPLLEEWATAKFPFWEPMCCSQAPNGNPGSLHPPKIFLLPDLGTRLTNARHPKLRSHSIGGSIYRTSWIILRWFRCTATPWKATALEHPGQDHTVEPAPLPKREHMNHAASRRTGGCPR